MDYKGQEGFLQSDIFFLEEKKNQVQSLTDFCIKSWNRK